MTGRRIGVIVRLRRLGYRLAHALLVAGSLVLRPHTRGVKCLVVCGEEVLLLRHSYGSRRWDLPGGFCRRREPFEDAARREVREELGIDAGHMVGLGERTRRHQGRLETARLYRIDVATREIVVDPVEIAEARWFLLAALPADRSDVADEALALALAPAY